MDMSSSSLNQYDIIMNQPQQSSFDDPLVQYFLNNEDTTSLMNNAFDLQACGVNNSNNNNNMLINTSSSSLFMMNDPTSALVSTTLPSYPSSPSVVPNSSPYDSNSSSLSTPEQQQCFINIENGQQQSLFNEYSSMQPIFAGQQQIQPDEQHITMLEFPVVQFDPSNMNINGDGVGIHVADSSVSEGAELPMFSSSSPDQLDTLSPSSSNEESVDETPSPTTTTSTKQKKRGTETRVQNLVHPLTRDELLKLSGKEPVKITEQDAATLADERSFKKQRRLIKNRESAQLSRMRKKIFIEDLEKKISDLTTENKSLRDEVLYLQGILKQVSKNNPDVSQQIKYHESMRTKNAKAAGVCLLIFIFSIGVFLNPQQATQQQQQQPFTNSLVTRRVISNIDSNNIALPELTHTEFRPTSPDVIPELPAPEPTTSVSAAVASSSKTSKRQLESVPSTPVQQEKKRIRIIPTNEHTDDLVSVGHIESPRPTRVRREEDTSSPASPRDDHYFNIIPSSRYQDGPAHSSYIICSDQPRIISNNLNQTTQSLLNSNPSSPLTLGLLVPSDMLGINVTTGNMPQERPILEISCQVNNIRVWNPLSIQDHLQSSAMVDARNYDNSNTNLVIRSP